MIKPEILPKPDFSRLIELIDNELKISIENKYENDDFQHYIYEEVMTSIYGKMFWAWRNSRNW